MSIKQEFKFTPAEGKELITLHQWVSTLSENEQQEFRAAEQRQLEIRQKIVKNKKLTVIKNSDDDTTPDNYVWDESQIENKSSDYYKDYDDTWLVYWKRYLSETETKFEIVETKL